MRIKVLLSVIIICNMWMVNLSASEKMNQWCPVLTDEPSEAKFKTEFEGKVLYFCCKKCVRKFVANPELYKENIKYSNHAQNLKTQQQEQNPSEHEHDSDAHKSSSEHEHGSSSKEHDHSKDHAPSANYLQSLIAKMHPILVHFPIAGIYFAFLLQMVSFVMKDKPLDFSIRFLLILSSLSIGITFVSGWNNAAGQSFSGEDLELVFLHRWLAASSCIAILLATMCHLKCYSMKGKHFAYYMTFLILAVGLVSLTGHFGGMLVYGPEYFDF